MKKKIGNFLICTILVSSGIIFIPNAFAENVPEWVKNTAGWWATDAISETEFVNAIVYLIKVGIITIEKDCNFDDEKYTLPKIDRWFLYKLFNIY